METAVPDALEGLEMSSANRRLPEELWAHVASYASGPTWRTRRGELLALRAASKLIRDAVARAVVDQTLETLSFARTDGIVPANALLNLVDVCPRLKVLEGNLCLQAPRSCFKTGTARDYDYSYWNGAKCFALWEGPFTEFDSALLDAKDTLAEVLKSRGGERRRGMNGRFFEDHLV